MFKKRKSSLSIGDSKIVLSLRIIRLVGTIFCVIGILFGAYKIIKWQVEREIADEQVKEVQETEIKEIADSENTEIIQTDDTNKDDPYWEYVKMSMLDVDFKDLLLKNPDTVGWVKVDGTSINYPFVRGSDNKFYLNHTFNRSLNSAGWVYLDYRNDKSLTKNRNSILYAHNRLDSSLFGTLRKVLTSSWQNNPNNHVVKIATETETSLWQVFSVYKTPVTSDYLKVNFEANNEFLMFAEKLKSRSVYNFNTSVSLTDKILTLSTCSDDNNGRIVLHAKLIKTTPKV